MCCCCTYNFQNGNFSIFCPRFLHQYSRKSTFRRLRPSRCDAAQKPPSKAGSRSSLKNEGNGNVIIAGKVPPLFFKKERLAKAALGIALFEV